jgi:UDP-2,3-diacylglucosamine hydrolase
LLNHALEVEQQQHFDYYIFGHRHLLLDLAVGETGARYINLGEWCYDSAETSYHFAVWDGSTMKIESALNV